MFNSVAKNVDKNMFEPHSNLLSLFQSHANIINLKALCLGMVTSSLGATLYFRVWHPCPRDAPGPPSQGGSTWFWALPRVTGACLLVAVVAERQRSFKRSKMDFDMQMTDYD